MVVSSHRYFTFYTGFFLSVFDTITVLNSEVCRSWRGSCVVSCLKLHCWFIYVLTSISFYFIRCA